MDEATRELNDDLGEIKLDWKIKPTLRELKLDYEEARPYHDRQVARINRWLDNLHVRGKAAVTTGKNRSKIVPKLIRKQAEWRYPALSDPFLVDQDIFNVSPVEWSDKEAAEQNSLVLNNQFNNDIDKVEFIGDTVRTLVDEGTVILFVGWENVEEEYEVEEDSHTLVYDETFIPILEELAQLRAHGPDNYEEKIPYELQAALESFEQDGVPRRPKVTGTEIVTKTRVLVNRPMIEVCNTKNVIIDPSCNGNYRKANFITREFETSLSDLTKDGRYFNLDKLNIKNLNNVSDGEFDSAIADGDFNFKDDARKRFVVRESWTMRDIDGNGKTSPIVCAWVGNVLIRLERNPFPHKGLPFVVIKYLPVVRSCYGEPDGELLEDNQRVIGAVTRGMLDTLAKSANGQTGMRKDMLDPLNKINYENGRDYMFNSQVDPRQGIFQHTYTEFSNSAQYMLQMQSNEAESLTGVKAFAGGLTGDAFGETATGTRGVLDAASKRELGILRRLGAGIVEVGKMIIAMNSVFLSEQETIRITNDKFVSIQRKDLESKVGKFDLKLTISTAEEDDARAGRLEFVLQTMGPNLDQDMRTMIMVEIAKLRKSPDLAKKLEEYVPQPDPMEERIKAATAAKLEAEVAEIQATAQAKVASAQLDQAKIPTEQAKVDNIRAATGQAALDFTEQSTGVKQERELQKQGEQARGNIELKKAEHGMKQAEEVRKETKVDVDKFLAEYMKEPKTNTTSTN